MYTRLISSPGQLSLHIISFHGLIEPFTKTVSFTASQILCLALNDKCILEQDVPNKQVWIDFKILYTQIHFLKILHQRVPTHSLLMSMRCLSWFSALCIAVLSTILTFSCFSRGLPTRYHMRRVYACVEYVFIAGAYTTAQKWGQDSNTALHYLTSCRHYKEARKRTFGLTVLKGATKPSCINVSDLVRFIRMSGRFDHGC